MARSLDSRLRKLETPSDNRCGAMARRYALLRACYEALGCTDGEPIPTEAELWATARAGVASGHAPAYTTTLHAVWARERP